LLQWDRLSAVTGYTPSSLASCLNDLLALFSEAASLPHPAIREKYAKDKYAVEPGNLCHILSTVF